MASTTYDIRINATQAERELQRLQSSLQSTNNIFGQLRDAVAGFAIGSFITNTIQMAASLDDIATSSGIALQNVVGFANAVRDSGGDIDGAIQGIGRFARFMEDAADGNKKAQDTFLELGISLEELRTLSEADLLRRTIQGLGEMSDKTQRLSTQIDIFGKSFATVSLAEVNADIERYTANAKDSANAIKSAADAEKNFGIAVGAVRDTILKTIEPFTSFIASLKPETIERFANSLSMLVAAFVGLKIISVISSSLLILSERFALAAVSGGGLLKSLVAIQLANMQSIFSEMAAGLIGLKNAFTVASGGAALFATALTTLARSLTRLLGYIGIALLAFDALNSVIKSLTGNGIVQWLDEAGKSMANLLGITYQTSKEKEALAAAQETAKEKAQEQARAIREVEDAMKKETDAMNKSIRAYKDSNNASNARYALETKLIGVSERQRLIDTGIFEARSKYIQELSKLEADKAAKAASSSKTEQAQVAVIQQKINELTKSYLLQNESVQKLAKSRADANEANQIRLFQIQSQIDNENKLRSIGQETATKLLPEIERQYMAIAAAAENSARAAIAAEEARRGPGQKLNTEEVQRYYQAAFEGVDRLVQAQTELNRVNQEAQFLQYNIRERISYENELQKILDERSKLTMNELQRQEYDLTASAKARAKAEIEAEEARRGPGYRMSAEEQNKYYDTALSRIKDLKAANAELYIQSRSFETGWTRAFNAYAEEATNAARQAERIFQRVTSAMEDMIVNFVKTGKFEWKNFISMMLEELLRSQIQRVFAQMLGSMQSSILGLSAPSSTRNSLMPGESGGIPTGILDTVIGGIGSLFGGFFANGGTLGAGKWGIAGEMGPEIISGPATVTPMTSGVTNVTYNINAVDARSFKELVAADPSFIHAVAMQGSKGMPSRR